MSSKKKQDSPKAAPAKVTAKAPEAAAIQPPADFFSKLGKKAPLVALGALILIAVIVFKDYLLFDKVYFFKDIGSDSLNYSYSYLYHTADYIAKYGLPKWSFGYGMGQSLFPFFLRDPFDIFLYLAGKEHILTAMVYIEVLKIILGGTIFYYYLKCLKLSDFSAITGSLLFAFCGFTIVGSGWYFFSFESLNMALLLLAFEQLFTKGKWYLFPVAIFLLCISQPFNLYVYGLFLAIYALFRYLQVNSFNAKELGLLFGKMIGLGILGTIISAPFLIENVIQLLESPRGSGNTSYAHILSSMPMFNTADKSLFGTSVMRLFSSDILGSGTDFKGWQNFLEAPLLYCGLPCLLLVPQVFQFFDKRVKILFGIFLAVWLLPLVFPYFRHAFWLFTGDYFRAYSFLVGLVLLYYAMIALDMILAQKKINLIILIATVVFLFILLNYPYFDDKESINPSVSMFVSIMIVAYGALLFFAVKPGNAVYAKYGLFAAIVLELIFLSGKSVNDRDPITATELTQRIGYNDYTTDAVKYLKQTDNSFYRIDKSYASSPAIHYSINDAMAQGYRGTTEYNPFNQEYYVLYLQLMGISDKNNEQQSRWAMGLSNRPILESENRVKYLFAKKQINPMWQILCDTVGTFGDVRVFRNKFLLPLGYTYTHYIKESAFNNLSVTQKDFVSLQACIIKDNDASKVTGLKEFDLKDTVAPSAFNFDIYRSRLNELSKDTMSTEKFEETYISGKVNATEDEMLYLSVPYDGGWSLKVDGQPRDKMILSAGMTGVMLAKGQHTIVMSYDLRYFSKGLIIGFIGLLLYLGLWGYTRAKGNKKKAATE